MGGFQSILSNLCCKILGPGISGLLAWKDLAPPISPMAPTVSSNHFTLSVIVPTFIGPGRRRNMPSHDYDMDKTYFQPCWKKISKCCSKGALLVEILFGIYQQINILISERPQMSIRLTSVDDKDEILAHSKCKLVTSHRYSSLHRTDHIWVSTQTDTVEKTRLI
jgi:hypothetical protein